MSSGSVTIVANHTLNGRLTAFYKIWGLSLLERCLLVADGIGCNRLEIVADDKQQITDFLSSKNKLGPHINIRDATSDSGDATITLYGNFLYDAAMIRNPGHIKKAILHEIYTSADLNRAKELFWKRTFLPYTGMFFLELANRPLGKQITRIAVNTSITPNQFTFISLVIGIVGAIFFTFGTYGYTIIGVSLIELATCLDCVDGPLSRLKNLQTDFGRWFDLISDNIKICAVYICLSIGLYRHFGYHWIWFAGFFIQFGHFINIVVWLVSERDRTDLHEHSVKVKSNRVNKIKQIADKIFNFFTSIENFYFILLLGSILNVNLYILSIFASVLTLNVIYVICVRYIKHSLLLRR